MVTFIVRRILSLVPVAFIVLVVTFSLIHLTPGNPAYTILGDQASPQAVHLLDVKMGLTRPLPQQFAAYIGQVARGNLGVSLLDGQSVLSLIITRLPVTLELAVLAVIVSLLIAIPTGIFAAYRPNTWVDNLSRLLALVGAAIPNFWLALLLVYIFAVGLHWLPSLGWVPLTQSVPGNLVHLVLPVVVLALPLAAVTSRVLRGELIEVMHLLYIQVARAKGISEWAVVMRHGVRNALVPVVTVVGLQVGALLGGVVITETIFSLPGMGQLVVNAIFDRDYPVLDGSVLFMAFVVLLANLCVDLVYAWLDPRIRYN
ncbi:MAG: ABC transporter permease [Sulfobacillus thermosulfidooxidans]|uniref:ABC transporter permease n=1 Tax=Sulfobacillus TaxID=28033 RepID=UPI000CD172DC|nr:ABC transporter permease [Sulfobacillus sp. hq2]POB10079.1 glutathione ABC transporter permease GsiC [Sulfobacillus sp. hq2]PSR37719.1 MAG: ABC transporter permease [Sulfobacillus thermosulfidooxidans]